MDIILNHKSIRNFKSDPISDELLNTILLAGTKASNTGNMQAYSIIISKDKSQKEKLLSAHFNQKMVVQAPVTLTFCADFNRFSLWCKQRKAEPGFDNFMSFFTGATDAILASQNVSLAAEYNGLGICYLGTTTYNADQIIAVLKLPEKVVPITTVVIGYYEEDPGLTDRLALEAVIHQEIYKDYTSKDIDNFYHEKENSQLTEDLLKINKKETLAQIFTDNRYTKANNDLFSKKYLDVIRNQGFM